MYCTSCGAKNTDEAIFCQNCGAELKETAAAELNERLEQPGPELPMKWHKFLVYFSLWAGALLNAINGARMITGAQYGQHANAVYLVFAGLKPVDVGFGALLIVIAGFEVCTALSLLKFKKAGPNMLTVLYVTNAAATVLYNAIAAGIISSGGYGANLSSIYADAIGVPVISVIMLIINRIYYKKRKHLFVN